MAILGILGINFVGLYSTVRCSPPKINKQKRRRGDERRAGERKGGKSTFGGSRGSGGIRVVIVVVALIVCLFFGRIIPSFESPSASESAFAHLVCIRNRREKGRGGRGARGGRESEKLYLSTMHPQTYVVDDESIHLNNRS